MASVALAGLIALGAPAVARAVDDGGRADRTVQSVQWGTAAACRTPLREAPDPSTPEACAAVDGRPVSEAQMKTYESSWVHRALSLQRGLDEGAPLAEEQLPHTHNSFNASSYSLGSTSYYPTLTNQDPNQVYSLTDQLRMDVRAIEIDVLVSTTVIEVGVDVPNATVMLVEDAVRFGIAQLHQLRGRVGRGADKSWCYLLGEALTPDAEQRLEAVERSTDGFYLAEEDLEIRGEGTVLGTRQKGRSDLKLASLRRDKDWVATAREVAFDIVDADPTLRTNDVLAEEVRLLIDDDEAEFLFKS